MNTSQEILNDFKEKVLVGYLEYCLAKQNWSEYDITFEILRERGYFA